MNWLIDQLAKEWTVIKQTPISFVIVCVVSALLAFVLVRWMYQDRLKAATDLIGFYRERLGLHPADKTPYAGMRNTQLAQEVLRVTSELREVTNTYSEAMAKESLTLHYAMLEAKTDEERKQLFTQQMIAGAGYSRFSTIYAERFKVDVVLLRDEMLARLPDKKKPQYDFRFDENVVNPAMAYGVIERLESYAKLLPRG